MNHKQAKILFQLEQDDGYPPVSWESVWATKVNENKYKIDNIPFYIQGLSLNDIIEVNEVDGELNFEEIIEASLNSVIRIIIINEGKKDELRSNLKSMGCESELDNFGVLIAVDVPPDVSFNKVADYLQKGEDSGFWEYEEASIRHDS